MPPKAQQHVIPRVYLNAFCDPEPPAEHPAGQPYTGALWLIPKSLTEPPWRRSPRKAFRELNAYTLKGDDPHRPVIEERLWAVEDKYAPVLRRIAERAPLTLDECRTLALFVGTLFWRTPHQMRHWQRQVDEVQRIYRQVDRGATGHERHADAYWAGADEAGKRLVFGGAAGFANVLVANGWRLLIHEGRGRETAEAFVTSDAPVVHREVHVDELLATGVPGAWLDPDALPNRRAFLTHCPLAPDVSLVASPLLRAPRTLYWFAPGPGLVANLNLLARENARELLVASRPDPFGDLRPAILAADDARRAAAADTRPVLSVYTDRTRLQLRAESLEHGRGAHVLNGRLAFRTRDADALRILAEAERVPEVTYASREGSGQMRDARVVAVALSPEGETVIMNGPGFD